MFVIALILSLIEAAATMPHIGTGVVAVGCPTCQVQMGVWSQWSEWSQCGPMFGVTSQTRFRTCSMASCAGGSSSEARPCVMYVQPAPARWSDWGPWSSCSASCGGGTSQRTRVCTDPCTGCCLGTATETQSCNTQPCCEWSPWSPWSECSVTCGTGGVTYRTRQCSCVEGCAGPSNEQMPCDSDRPCPVPSTVPPLPPQPPQPPQPSQPLCITCYLPKPKCVTCTVYTWSKICCKK